MRFWGKENQGANLGGWGLFFEEVLTLRLTDGNVKVHGRKRLAQEGDGRSTGGQEACCVLLLAAAAINSCALVHWAKCVRGWVPQCECGHRSGELGTGLGCPLWQAGTSISRGRYRGQERRGVWSGVRARPRTRAFSPSTMQNGCTEILLSYSVSQYSIGKEAKPSRGGLATSCPVDFWLTVWFKTRPVSAVIVLPQAYTCS